MELTTFGSEWWTLDTPAFHKHQTSYEVRGTDLVLSGNPAIRTQIHGKRKAIEISTANTVNSLE
jgi:hypothetical protein